jgi:S-adenosylmethionine synthetase
MLTFMQSPRYFFTSESVTEGHPDKVCDQISDAVLDAYLRLDPEARVACEVTITGGLVMVMGEVTAHQMKGDPLRIEDCHVDVERVVRQVLADIGYSNADRFFDAQMCGVMVALKAQSGDIAQGVGTDDMKERGQMTQAKLSRLGAGDQGMMIGFACDETPDLIPLPISLAHGMCRRLTAVRKDGILDFLYPDGKSQVTVEYSQGKPKRVVKVLVAAQHNASVINKLADGKRVMSDDAQEAIIREVVQKVIPEELLPKGPLLKLQDQAWSLGDATIHVNTTGCFHFGGPMADVGLTGRKIIVDTYGGMARHGGGAFSGKDPTKVDRSASYAARYVAKNIVAAGLAHRCEVLLSYAIGLSEPFSIGIETFGTGCIPDTRIEEMVREHFDLRPGAIIRDLNLWRPIYRQTATYGHFGRPELDLPWERTDRAQVIALGAN